MKRAAITGIAGQDGTYLAQWLLHQGYEVHGLLRAPFEREEERLRRRFGGSEIEKIHWHCGALEDPFSLLHFLAEAAPDELYHLAGVTDSRLSFAVPEYTMTAITVGTLRLLDAVWLVSPGTKVFLASSAEVFGVPEDSPQDEGTPRRPITPYGIAHAAADRFAALYRREREQFISVGISYNHESPLRPPNYLSARVCRAVADIKHGQQDKLHLKGLDAERDWGDARDFVKGFWRSLQAREPGDFVFATGQSRTVRDLVECAFAAAGLDWERHVVVDGTGPATPQVSTGLCGDPDKAGRELGWRRDWTFEQTIHDMVRSELDKRLPLDFPANAA